MKLSDLTEVSDLDDRLQDIERERKRLVESQEISVKVHDVGSYSETISTSMGDAARSVITAFDAYLEWLEGDIKERLKELGVEP
jgi:hypothetical protein